MILLSLIGKQTIPNLLPIRQLQPQENVLVYTGEMEPVARRLLRTLGEPDDLKQHVRVDAYNLARIIEAIEARLHGLEQVTINLTGGTKIMALAAYQVALHHGWPFVYYESRDNCLYPYHFEGDKACQGEKLPLPTVIDLRDYLKAHLDDYTVEGYHREGGVLSSGGHFERAVDQALKARGFETLAGVRPVGDANPIEMDLVLRLGNKVGVAEIKTGYDIDTVKRGLDQLKMAAGPEYLGTFTLQFFISAGRIHQAGKNLARERGVAMIELPNYKPDTGLSKTDAENLARQVKEKFEPRRR